MHTLVSQVLSSILPSIKSLRPRNGFVHTRCIHTLQHLRVAPTSTSQALSAITDTAVFALEFESGANYAPDS